MEAAIENPVIFKGDVPLSIQKQIVAFSDFHLKDVNFARTTGRDLILTEAAVYKRPEDRKLQSRVVYQIIVGEGTLRIAYTRPGAVCAHTLSDMLNRQRTIHGGCTAFLVDVCVPCLIV